LKLHQQRKNHERVVAEGFFTFGMLAVGLMQCLTVFGMASYLNEKSTGYTDELKLATGLFTIGGATMSVDQSQDLCGTFTDLSLNSFAGVDSVKMLDGTSFQGTATMPAFHPYKMPSGSWIFHSVGNDESYIDKQLRVVHGANFRDGWTYISHARVEYGVLLVIMVSWLWFHCLYEFRKIMNFTFVLNTFYDKGFVKDPTETTTLDENGITIVALTRNAWLVGWLCIIMRVTVSSMMLVWGTSLLVASWDKLSLVLNSLAIGIVFELDGIIAYACIDHNTMQRIERIAPVHIPLPAMQKSHRYLADICLSIVLFVGVFLASLAVRYWQLDTHMHQLHTAGALCLFAGAPPAAHPDVVAPVPGFCESLLSMTCAPNVTGPGSHHGPCLITDQHLFHDQTVMMHGDEALFDDLYDADGKRQSMASWGGPKEKMLASGIWQEDQQLNLFRQICTQLYRPESAVDRRTVDANIGLSTNSAPFYCPRETVFEAVFGGVQNPAAGRTSFDKWSTSFDLTADRVVAALDKCGQPTKMQESAISPGSAAPAPAPAPAPERGVPKHAVVPPGLAPDRVADPVKFLRRHHGHRHHQEIYHSKMENVP